MAEIIKIKEGVAFVQINGNQIKEIKVDACKFEPTVGDHVEIYQNNQEFVLNKLKRRDDLYQSQIYDEANPVYISKCETKGTNKVIYACLALFLGGLGAHKFYAHHYFTGIIYLIFVWTLIPILLGVLEFIMALFIKADGNGYIVV